MQYKGKTLVSPPVNTKYVPITVRTVSSTNNMAVTDIEIIGDTVYCKIGEDTYIWNMDEAVGRVLTDSLYRMMAVYPEFASMSEIPEVINTSQLTTAEDMFTDRIELEQKIGSATRPNTANTKEIYDFVLSNMEDINLEVAPEMDMQNIKSAAYMFGYLHVEPPYFNSTNGWFIPTPTFRLGCKKLKNIPKYNTENIENFQGMFTGCLSLPSVFPWPISVDSAKNAEYGTPFASMFTCSSVEEVSLVYYDSSITPQEYAENYQISTSMLDFSGRLKKIKIYNIPLNERTDEKFASEMPYVIERAAKDASIGNMCNLYDNYKGIDYVTDALDFGERTSLSGFFSDTLKDKDYSDDDGLKGKVQDGDGGCRRLLVAPTMDTSKITDMSGMFGIKIIYPIMNNENWPPKTKTFEYINACVSMISIPQYDTSNVTNFQGMFAYCENLRDVPELNMSKAEDVSYMFQGCTSLPETFPWEINLSNLRDRNSAEGMFSGSSVKCVNLILGDAFKPTISFDDNGNMIITNDTIPHSLFGLPDDAVVNIRFSE